MGEFSSKVMSVNGGLVPSWRDYAFVYIATDGVESTINLLYAFPCVTKLRSLDRAAKHHLERLAADKQQFADV